MLSLCSSRLDFMRLLNAPSPPSLSKLLHAFSLFLYSFFHDFFTLLLSVYCMFFLSSSLLSWGYLLNTLSLSSSSWSACMSLPQVTVYQLFYPPFSPFLLFQAMIFSFLSFLLQSKNNLYIFIVFLFNHSPLVLSESLPQSNELTRGPNKLVQQFRF
jgi:hypothetical protein